MSKKWVNLDSAISITERQKAYTDNKIADLAGTTLDAITELDATDQSLSSSLEQKQTSIDSIRSSITSINTRLNNVYSPPSLTNFRLYVAAKSGVIFDGIVCSMGAQSNGKYYSEFHFLVPYLNSINYYSANITKPNGSPYYTIKSYNGSSISIRLRYDLDSGNVYNAVSSVSNLSVIGASSNHVILACRIEGASSEISQLHIFSTIGKIIFTNSSTSDAYIYISNS